MQKFKLSVATAEKRLFEGEAESVTVPGEDGEMTILAGHAPLLSTLKSGKIKIFRDSHGESFEINGGFIEVNNEGTTILAKNLSTISTPVAGV